MTDPVGPALLSEALDWLDAHAADLILDPLDGLWRLLLDGEVVSTGDVVARAIGLGMLGATKVQ